jgi:hypothetical protein
MDSGSPPHLAHRTDRADRPVVSSAAKPLPPPAPSDNTTVPLKSALWHHSLPKPQRAGNGSNAPTVILKCPMSGSLRLCQWWRDIQPDRDWEPNKYCTWISFESFSVAFELSFMYWNGYIRSNWVQKLIKIFNILTAFRLSDSLIYIYVDKLWRFLSFFILVKQHAVFEFQVLLF